MEKDEKNKPTMSEEKKYVLFIIAAVAVICVIGAIIFYINYPSIQRKNLSKAINDKDWDNAISICQKLNDTDTLNDIYYLMGQDYENKNVYTAISAYEKISDINPEAKERLDYLNNIMSIEGTYVFDKDLEGILTNGRGGDISVTVFPEDDEITVIYRWDRIGSAEGVLGEIATADVEIDSLSDESDVKCSFEYIGNHELKVKYFFNYTLEGKNQFYEDTFIYVKK